jgi:hypothetical protein
MRLDVTPTDPLRELFPDGVLHTPQGTKLVSPEGLTVTYEGAIEFRGVDIAPILQLAVAIATGLSVKVAGDLIVRWLVDTFRGRSTSLKINETEVDLDDEGQVRRIVTREIRKK